MAEIAAKRSATKDSREADSKLSSFFSFEVESRGWEKRDLRLWSLTSSDESSEAAAETVAEGRRRRMSLATDFQSIEIFLKKIRVFR